MANPGPTITTPLSTKHISVQLNFHVSLYSSSPCPFHHNSVSIWVSIHHHYTPENQHWGTGYRNYGPLCWDPKAHKYHFKDWIILKHSHAIIILLSEFRPSWSNHLHFSSNSLPVLVLTNAVFYAFLQNKIHHPAHSHKWFQQVPLPSSCGIRDTKIMVVSIENP